MIQDKFSALIGFGLFLYAVITLVVLIGLCNIGTTFWGVVGGINTLLNGYVIYTIYQFFRIKE